MGKKSLILFSEKVDECIKRIERILDIFDSIIRPLPKIDLSEDEQWGTEMNKYLKDR